jgi:hypothetical protein
MTKCNKPTIKKVLDLNRENYEIFQGRYKGRVNIVKNLAKVVDRYIAEVLSIGDQE